MKIFCYFGGRTRLGGAERRIARIFNKLAILGFDMQLIFYLYEPIEQVYNAYADVIGDKVYIKLMGFNNHIKLMNYVIKNKPQWICYTGSYGSMLPFFVAGKICGSKTMLLAVTTLGKKMKIDNQLRKLFYNLICRLSSNIDCLYPEEAILLKKIFGKEKVTITPCSFTDFNKMKVSTNKKKIITFIGRWETGKNVELFINSLLGIEQKLRENGYSAILCGNAKKEKDTNLIIKNVNSSSCRDLITMPGYVNSEDFLPESEVFVSLQNNTNYPSQSLIEAISCGNYIIATNVGDTYRIVKPTFGTLCAISQDEVSKAICNYISKNDDAKKATQKAARIFAEKTFIIEKSVEHYKALFTNKK